MRQHEGNLIDAKQDGPPKDRNCLKRLRSGTGTCIAVSTQGSSTGESGTSSGRDRSLSRRRRTRRMTASAEEASPAAGLRMARSTRSWGWSPSGSSTRMNFWAPAKGPWRISGSVAAWRRPVAEFSRRPGRDPGKPAWARGSSRNEGDRAPSRRVRTSAHAAPRSGPRRRRRSDRRTP
jgi:hypothetical protein